mgnify:CR=1 FL=1
MPDYTNWGMSSPMGPRLRAVVEEQLVADLRRYGVEDTIIRFDWSECCIEGHNCEYLDGYVENFSGVYLFDANDNFVADGWMEFIHEPNFFLVYWDHLTFTDSTPYTGKKQIGIPPHVWQQIPDHLKFNYEKYRM